MGGGGNEGGGGRIAAMHVAGREGEKHRTLETVNVNRDCAELAPKGNKKKKKKKKKTKK